MSQNCSADIAALIGSVLNVMNLVHSIGTETLLLDCVVFDRSPDPEINQAVRFALIESYKDLLMTQLGNVDNALSELRDKISDLPCESKEIV